MVRQRGADSRGQNKVASMAWNEQPHTDGADLMPGTPDALDGTGNAQRRLQQHNLVNGTDVDTHFKRAGCDDRLQFARLQACLDSNTQFTCQ